MSKDDWALDLEGSVEMELIQEIKLNAPEDVKEFVNAASRCEFDIDVNYNRVIVDAKSLLGVLSMDLTKKIKVSCMGYDSNFEKTLRKYAIQ